jgi:hypothetical protein
MASRAAGRLAKRAYASVSVGADSLRMLDPKYLVADVEVEALSGA